MKILNLSQILHSFEYTKTKLMKRMKLTMAVLFTASLAFTACKGDYTCNCKISGVDKKTEFKDVKKDEADDDCEQLETVGKFTDPNAKCTLD